MAGNRRVSRPNRDARSTDSLEPSASSDSTAESSSSILNLLRARVHSISPADESHVIVRLTCGDDQESASLLARITRKSAHRLALAAGKPVFARVKSAGLRSGAGS